MTPRSLFAPVAVALAVLAGCSTLDYKQREWIFQPSDRAWGGVQQVQDMQDVYIDFQSDAEAGPARLHALWLPAATPANLPMGVPAVTHGSGPPVLLYLHGARWNVVGSASRIRRMQEMGFSVLAIDYRGFGKSSAGLPSEATAAEDAQAAWDWLAQRFPDRSRYVFGHSLGGAIAIDLATRIPDASGVIVEGTFTNIADVVSTFKWGWLPFSALITQRFESIDKVKRIQAPLLVVHGSEDSLIPAALGRRLYDAAKVQKQFVLVPGGSHHSTNAVGESQYRGALKSLFGLNTQPALPSQADSSVAAAL
ncbi:alpha/beta fold hydrolase [uncultured Xylophilus sp.]|uniref:alpha/beta hydrolase n=1 Tax=uncultured Xylophilus sp. TaxID=296832 RepID=UPI0025E0BE24|nr:alpha/beta fold hydrolase [uncultured Xylophilus sp.]